VHDLAEIETKLKTCCTESCSRYWASELVRAKWEAGLIPIPLTHEDMQKLVEITLKQYWEAK
jgi:hypothetical protein